MDNSFEKIVSVGKLEEKSIKYITILT